MSQSGCHGGVWSHHVHPTCTPSSHARTPHLSTWEGPRTQMYVQDLWPPNPPKSINSNHRTIMLVLLQATLPWTSLVITASKPRRKAYGKTTCSMSIDARSNKQLCKVNSLGGGRPCDRRSILVGRELVMGVASRIKSDHWWPLVFASSPCFVGVWVVCKNIVYGSYTRMASIQKKNACGLACTIMIPFWTIKSLWQKPPISPQMCLSEDCHISKEGKIMINTNTHIIPINKYLIVFRHI